MSATQAPISRETCLALWAHFDEHYGDRASSVVPEILPRALELEVFHLTRSQAKRQWDRWRRARRDTLDHDGFVDASLRSGNVVAHEHLGSLHAHRRRAFGADDTLRNRLHSVAHDAAFIAAVKKERLPAEWPLVANLRCGEWYAPPESFGGRVRFKSGDGHRGEWALSLRRLNLHLVDMLAEHGGGVVVDATRRGRVLPDSFAKTIPIWCCCVNRFIAGVARDREAAGAPGAEWDTRLHTAPGVAADEVAGIEARLDGFVASLRGFLAGQGQGEGQGGGAGSAGLLPALRCLRKPLRPLWLVAATSSAPEQVQQAPSPKGPAAACRLFGDAVAESLWEASLPASSGSAAPAPRMSLREAWDLLPFTPVICFSASEPVDRMRRSAYTYLQGSADDEEEWACLGGRGAGSTQLTAEVFWRHSERILAAADDDCERVTRAVLLETAAAGDTAELRFPGEDPGGCNSGASGFQSGAGALGKAEALWHWITVPHHPELKLAVGGRRAGRPPECWDHFDAIINVTMDEYEDMRASMRPCAVVNAGVEPGVESTTPEAAKAGEAGACHQEGASGGGGSYPSFDSVRLPSPPPESGAAYLTACSAAAGLAPRAYLRCPVAEGKRDVSGLEAQLPAAIRFACVHLAAGRRLLVHCAQGRDRSVAVAVAILAALAAPSLAPAPGGGPGGAARALLGRLERLASLSTGAIRAHVALKPGEAKPALARCLHVIAVSRPGASPSRHTLKKIARFFSSDR